MEAAAVAVIGIIGAIIAAVLGSVGTQRQQARDFDYNLTTSIRGERVQHYRELLPVLEPLSIEWTEPFDHRALMRDLRAWYYKGGGLFLSDDAQWAFWTLQELLGERRADAPPIEAAGFRNAGLRYRPERTLVASRFSGLLSPPRLGSVFRDPASAASPTRPPGPYPFSPSCSSIHAVPGLPEGRGHPLQAARVALGFPSCHERLGALLG